MGKYCFGVDVGGTTVKLGLFNTSGDLMEKWEIPTVTEDDGKAILPDCAKSILKKMDERKMDPHALFPGTGTASLPWQAGHFPADNFLYYSVSTW